jgi:hypothetical protein
MRPEFGWTRHMHRIETSEEHFCPACEAELSRSHATIPVQARIRQPNESNFGEPVFLNFTPNQIAQIVRVWEENPAPGFVTRYQQGVTVQRDQDEYRVTSTSISQNDADLELRDD